jgi:adenosylcobinamide-phosphate synthase
MLLIDAAPLLAGLLLALALDALTGDPDWLYRRMAHPVVLIGRAAAWLEARWLDPADPAPQQRRYGVLATLVVVAASWVLALAVQALCLRSPYGWLALCLLMSSLLAFRGLHQHVAAVAGGLERSLADGRLAVARIVGRDPARLDRPAVARAAIESTAENFADGVVAPLFWGLLLGLPGMLTYKAINTLDSMIGHRSERYRHFGWCAARLDDLVNWLPARLAALLILMAAFLLGTTPAEGWRAMWRDAPRHRSPNAGWPEAAMAGCLGLRLAGPRHYGGELIEDAWMGAGRAAATVADIRRTLRLLSAATLLLGALLAADLAVASHARAGELEQPVDVERGIEMVGQRIERRLDLGLVGDARGLPLAQPREECVAKAVGGEQAMQVAAHDPAAF